MVLAPVLGVGLLWDGRASFEPAGATTGDRVVALLPLAGGSLVAAAVALSLLLRVELSHRGIPDRGAIRTRRGRTGLMPVEEPPRIRCRLDELLTQRDLTLAALAERVGVSVVDLSVPKNQHAKAVRFSTLTGLCDALEWTPGELFAIE